jgi:hypothetical protein
MSRKTSRFLASTFALGGALTALLHADLAHACGGFFCNNVQPVNQAAERIIFSQAEDGTVTAIIQIQYSGEAESFAWVLPVTGSPEVHVSSNLAFQRLQTATNPQYTLTTRIEGSCRDADSRSSPSFGVSSDAGLSRSDAGGPIRVVNEGSVGPYDFIVINVDPMTPRASDAAVAWLRANEFQIDEGGADRLEPYLAPGMNLMAFRLTKGNSTGSIRPVEITFGRGQPSIPIRPTAVAAVADMGVMVWVLGAHRAVPINYASLELNEALINWINPTSNYNDVVTEAANQAGGQGFVTELAGTSATLSQVLYPDFEREGWTDLTRGGAGAWTGREGELFNTALARFQGFDGVREALRSSIALPSPDVTYEQLLSCPSCYFPSDTMDIEGFEPAAFLTALEQNVIEPMERTSALFTARPYVTRLYTTMSAEEMTRDPAFDFNADLPDLSNIHNAERVIECSPSISQFEAPWRVSLASGETLRGRGNTWPLSTTGSVPANRAIRRYETTGEGELIVDNAATIATAIRENNARIPGPPPSSASGGASGGGCSATHSNTHASNAWMVSLLGALALVIRRRR